MIIKILNLGKNHKVLIVFDDMITDIISNKNLNPIVIELFIRGRKLNISLVFFLHNHISNYQKTLD